MEKKFTYEKSFASLYTVWVQDFSKSDLANCKVKGVIS